MSTARRAGRNSSMAGGGGGRARGAEGKRDATQGQWAPAATAGYFTAELAVLFLCLTPLLVFPPPPSLLLLAPVGLMAVLIALAFVPSDSWSIASLCH